MTIPHRSHLGRQSKMQSARTDIHFSFVFSDLRQHVGVRATNNNFKELPQTRSWCNSYVVEEPGVLHSSMIAYVSALSPRRAWGPAFPDDCVCKRPIIGRARGRRFPDELTYMSRHACLLSLHDNKMSFMTAPSQLPMLIHHKISRCQKQRT